jgi:hydrogenase maturation protease
VNSDGNGRAPHLVLGLGNELFSDEGVGVVAARRLAERGIPGVDVLDGGTLGLALLPEVEGRETLVVFDAVVDPARKPGDLVVLHRDELERRGALFSAHQLGIPEVLAAAALVGRAPHRIAAVGMVPASLETGYGLSPTAAARLDDMVGMALFLLADWQVPAHA